VTSITKSIERPVVGERALAVHPRISPGGDEAAFEAQGWRRRTRYVPGRSITDRALQTDQGYIGGQLSTAGQRLDPGVVVGLEVTIEGPRDALVLHIAPGVGVCLNGEDVRVPHPVEIPAGSLWVESPTSTAQPRRLSALLAEDLAAARAMIVQLRPVVVERTGTDDADSPCEVDPDSIAFADEQLVDGCRVRLLTLGLPPSPAPATWRNEVIYSVFAREANDGIAGVPWQTGGLPIAVLGFPPGSTSEPFIDVHGAARRGGNARARALHHAGSGTAALHQARLDQFLDEVRDADIDQLTTAGLQTRFRHLPPFGMLPPGTIDVRRDLGEPDYPLQQPPILPASWVVEVVPVEIESLDAYVDAGVCLTPFDTTMPEQVQVLVPVPQQHFDPDLLIVEDETPDEFRDTIERILLVLNHRLGRRLDARGAERLLERILAGADLEHAAEPRAVEGEVAAFFPVDSVLLDAGLPVPPSDALLGQEVMPRVRTLIRDLFNAVGGPSASSPINPLSAVLRAAFISFGGAAGTLTNLEQDTADETIAFFLQHRFGGRGLVAFANFCVERLVLASERITLSFERMQAELHRVRQYVSGEEVANQLAISPVVAAIAVRDTAARPPATLRNFAARLRTANQDQRPPSSLPAAGTLVPTAGIATGGRAIASSVLFGRNILQRLDSSPPAFDASANADRATREALRTVLYIHDELGLSLEGIAFPPRLFNRQRTTPPLGLAEPITIGVIRQEVRRWLEQGVWNHEFDDEVGTTEAAFFANAIRRLEELVAVLRVAEARLTAYEAAVDLMRDAVDELTGLRSNIRQRLLELQDEIDELRHDVRVARALEREEMARATRLNALRRQVIAEHVPFLVFRRPRTVEALRVPPAVPVEPFVESEAVPDCLDDHAVPPDEIAAMLDLLRDMPVNRLKIGAEVVSAIDKREPLLAVVDLALHLAQTPLPLTWQPFAGAVFSDRIGLALRSRYTVHRAAIDTLRLLRGQRVTVLDYRTHSWSRLRSLVLEHATVGDLLRAQHGKHRSVQRLSQEIEDLTRVATCLYEKFQAVPPIVRLGWVAQVSEEDEDAPRLSDLSVLPNWEAVDRLQRSDLQSLTDWIFSRLDPDHDDGIAYASDVVRVALLLSGHAPVRQVLDAVVVAPHPVAAGGFLRLQIDPSRVRVGMHVELFPDSARRDAVARGIVDDLADGAVAVRVISTNRSVSVVPTHALLSEPSMGPTVALAGGRVQTIGVASRLS
jgi:hypothetical protein